MSNKNFSARWVTLLCCGAMASTVSASGFRLPELSTAGTALSNAVVANPDLPGALPYNPSAMAFHEEGQIVGGIVLVQPDISVDPEVGNSATSQGEDNVFIPNIFVSKHIDQQWSWGVGLNAPFGLETKWEAGTFGTFTSPLIPAPLAPTVAGLEPEHSKIEMLNLNPNVAYQLNSSTSVALGIDYYMVRELVFNTQAVKIDGDGRDYGWNIGLLHVQNNWSIGLSYRSSVKVDLDGSVEMAGIPSDAKAEVEFPDMLQLGGRYKLDDKLAVEFDIERTGWSSFDVIEIEYGAANPIVSENNWDDAIAYRLGATYDLSPNNQLLFGYANDKTPSDDDFFSARIPGNDRQTYSVGLAHDRGNWTLELAYMYVKADSRNIASTTSYIGGLPGNTDPNGTDAYNGKYELSAHLFAIGASTQF